MILPHQIDIDVHSLTFTFDHYYLIDLFSYNNTIPTHWRTTERRIDVIFHLFKTKRTSAWQNELPQPTKSPTVPPKWVVALRKRSVDWSINIRCQWTSNAAPGKPVLVVQRPLIERSMSPPPLGAVNLYNTLLLTVGLELATPQF